VPSVRIMLLINVSHMPRVSRMPVNTMAVMCQVWAVCLSIQWQSCAKCEQCACQYNGSHAPSVSSVPVNTIAVTCQVWTVCLSIQWQSCPKCEQYAYQYNSSHMPSESSVPVVMRARAPFLKLISPMCLRHTECLDSIFQSKKCHLIKLITFKQNISRL